LYTFLPVIREKTTSVTENPEKARLTTLIQSLVIFTKLGVRVDNEVPQGMKRYKYAFFKNTKRQKAVYLHYLTGCSSATTTLISLKFCTVTYTPCPKKRPTLSFAVTSTCLHQNGQNLAHKKKKLRATKRT